MLHANRSTVDPVTEEDLHSEMKVMISRELMIRVMEKLGTLEEIKKKKVDKSKKKGIAGQVGH